MVNKCSVTGCKSLYLKDNVRLHRFPLTNEETLPLWIAATRREKEWKPCKSSRLCGNHFQESEYIVGHGKGVLKTTAVPTIEYRVEIPRYNKRKNSYFYGSVWDNKMDEKTKPVKENYRTNVEIVQLNYNDIYESKYEQENNNKTDNSYGKEDPYIKNEYHEKQNEEISTNETCNDYVPDNKYYGKEDDNNYNDTLKYEYDSEETTNYGINNNICNRENQCYMFTSSFKEGVEPLVLSSSDYKFYEETSNMNIDHATADSKFNRIMALKLKKKKRTKDIYSLYFKSLKKKTSQKYERSNNSFSDDSASFGTFIETQMKELRQHRKLYLVTKHKIQKILMKAQLKLEKQNNSNIIDS